MPVWRSRARISLIILLLFCTQLLITPTAAALDTESLFHDVSEAIVQVKISNIHSAEKSSIGSGFFVSQDGHLITNYHVISSVAREPDNYRVELILHDGSTQSANIIDIDLIHDLALLQSEAPSRRALHFYHGTLAKGMELASVGNPHDLGMTAVKGTYSGYLADYLYERIHFSGAINPGMSGGPTMNGANEVVGINVATAGNEVGFLVPGKYAEALLRRTGSVDAVPDLVSTMHRQLLENQENYSHTIFASGFPLTELGDYQVPDKWGNFMRCWGDSSQGEADPYQIISKQCSSEDAIYIDEYYSTGMISMEHNYLSSDELSPFRFARLYELYFADTPAIDGDEEDLTSFECNTNFVQTGHLKMKLALCLRRHLKFEGLYDVVLKGATLERPTSGIQTTLHVTGISYSNAMALVQRYITAFRWKE